uniref:Secreted protein n=1 Tax=Prolemur simus TaxID=1328070 RepID=A0A8C8Z9P8_PROSS
MVFNTTTRCFNFVLCCFFNHSFCLFACINQTQGNIMMSPRPMGREIKPVRATSHPYSR